MNPTNETVRQVLGVVLASAVIGACARSPRLAGGPIEVGATPVLVRFDQPVTSKGPVRELCLEFDLPGDSHRAAAIEAALISAAGERVTFRGTELDRRGESMVCQIVEPEAGVVDAEPTSYVGVELRSDSPVRLRGIRGG